VKEFNLAGLLRLRRTEEDIAGAELARINHRLRENDRIDHRARLALAGYGEEATSTETLRAIAASRQSSAVALAELRATREQINTEQQDAQSKYTTARTRSVSLEKLEERHRERMFAEDLRAEQAALDELTNNKRPENGEDV
jgi:flagellar FliJ protein